MKYYEIDKDGIFTGVLEIGENSTFCPDERCITVEPPETAPGEVAVWRDGAWSVVEDHRGQQVYNTQKRVWETVQATGALAAWQIPTPPPSAYHIWIDGEGWTVDPARRDEIKDILRARIDAKTDAEIFGGFEFEGKRFKLSLENQFNYKAEVELADNLTYPHRIKSIDGYFDVPDAAAYRRFYLAAVGYIRATVETGWAAKDELDDLTDAELAAELLEA